MIATFFIIFAFIRAFPWSRKRAYSHTPRQAIAPAESIKTPPLPATGQQDEQSIVPKIQEDKSHFVTTHPVSNIRKVLSSSNNSVRKVSATRRKSSKSIKSHEVTFSGSVGNGDSDPERTPTVTRSSRLVRQARSFTATTTLSPSRANSPESNSSSNYNRSASSSRSQNTRDSSDYETAAAGSYTTRSKSSVDSDLRDAANGIARSSSNGCLKRIDTYINSDEEEASAEHLRSTEADADNEAEVENAYDRDTEEFYSNIQDAAGTSGTRSKRSSLFSRSDSSATTTSSSGYTFTGANRRSTASIISTSMCSDIIPIDRRRSSTTTEYSVRSLSSQPRRLSGRIRRHITRLTIGGARRRTTGRYKHEIIFQN